MRPHRPWWAYIAAKEACDATPPPSGSRAVKLRGELRILLRGELSRSMCSRDVQMCAPNLRRVWLGGGVGSGRWRYFFRESSHSDGSFFTAPPPMALLAFNRVWKRGRPVASSIRATTL